MSSKNIKYHLKSGLIGGLCGGLGSYIIIEFIKALDKSVGIVTLSFVPFLFLVPIILEIINIIDFRNMFVGYTAYILGYICSLFILMDAKIISRVSGWIYVVICVVLIIIKLIYWVNGNGKKHY